MPQEVINAYLASLQTHSQPLPTKRGEPENEAKSQSSRVSTAVIHAASCLPHNGEASAWLLLGLLHSSPSVQGTLSAHR